MTEKNPHPENHHDRVDALVDAALAQYSAAEPRTGLEERILTHLRLRKRTDRRVGWLPIAIAAAIALVAIPAYLVWRDVGMKPGTQPGTQPGAQTAREHVARNVAIPRQDEELRRRGTTLPNEPGQTLKERTMRATALSPVSTRPRGSHSQENPTELYPKSMANAVAGPRQDRFPAAAPLTEQEILLARYGLQVRQAASAEPSPIKDLEIEALNVAPIAIDQPEK